MAKPEWGTKRICPNCGARYYDLRKQSPVCPVCGTDYDPEALLRSRRARPVPVEEVRKEPAARPPQKLRIAEEEDLVESEVEEDVPVEEIEEEEEPPEDEEEVLIEDTSELGEDDMEVVEVEGGVEDEEVR